MSPVARLLSLGAAAVLIAAPAHAATDAGAAVAAALFAASATQAALTKSFDAKLRAQAAAITMMKAQVAAGKARVADLTAAEEKLVGQLGEKDRAYAEAIAVFRRDVTDIAATPEGPAALARFNSGDEVGALGVLDRLSAANDRAREKHNVIESAAEKRRIAGLALEAEARGKVSATAVIVRYEDVVSLDPDVLLDWVNLADLYLKVGRQRDLMRAGTEARRTSTNDRQRAAAAFVMGDALVLAGDTAGAQVAYRDGLDLVRRSIKADPADRQLRRQLIGGLLSSSKAAAIRGDFQELEENSSEAFACARALTLEEQDNAEDQSLLAFSEAALGSAQTGTKPIEAQDHLLSARERIKILIKESRSSSNDQLKLLDISSDLGALQLSMGKIIEAKSNYEKALAMGDSLIAFDPLNIRLNSYVAEFRHQLAKVAEMQLDFAGAEAGYRQSLADWRRLLSGNPTGIHIRHGLERCLHDLGTFLATRQRSGESRAFLEEGVAILRPLSAADPTNVLWQMDLISTLLVLGDLVDRAGDHATADHLLREAMTHARVLAAQHTDNQFMQNLALAPLSRLALIPGSGVSARDLIAGMDAVEKSGQLDASLQRILVDLRKAAGAP